MAGAGIEPGRLGEARGRQHGPAGRQHLWRRVSFQGRPHRGHEQTQGGQSQCAQGRGRSGAVDPHVGLRRCRGNDLLPADLWRQSILGKPRARAEASRSLADDGELPQLYSGVSGDDGYAESAGPQVTRRKSSEAAQACSRAANKYDGSHSQRSEEYLSVPYWRAEKNEGFLAPLGMTRDFLRVHLLSSARHSMEMKSQENLFALDSHFCGGHFEAYQMVSGVEEHQDFQVRSAHTQLVVFRGPGLLRA